MGAGSRGKEDITPFWVNTTRAEIEVGNKDGFINIAAEVRGKATVQSIDGTVTLQKKV